MKNSDIDDMLDEMDAILGNSAKKDTINEVIPEKKDKNYNNTSNLDDLLEELMDCEKIKTEIKKNEFKMEEGIHKIQQKTNHRKKLYYLLRILFYFF